MALTFSTGLAKAWLGDATSKELRELIALCAINIYSGTRPANPDAAISGPTLLAHVTVGGAATGGTFIQIAAGRTLSKTVHASEIWVDTSANATETATWFRLYILADDATVMDSSTTSYRIDGTCGSVGTEDLVLASSIITSGQPLTIDVFNITLPFTWA